MKYDPEKKREPRGTEAFPRYESFRKRKTADVLRIKKGECPKGHTCDDWHPLSAFGYTHGICWQESLGLAQQ